MFNKKPSQPTKAATGIDRIEQLVRKHLSDADDETRQLVVAIAGLLAGVTHVDRVYAQAEQAHVREVLGNVHGLDQAGVEAICAVLDTHGVEIAAGSSQRYSRALCELAEPDLRREVLQTLVDLAAADGELSLVETDLLRRTTTALALSQDDYVAAQARHRARLSVLK
jgi:uncharacterized tellurite resistance protein B-like protein